MIINKSNYEAYALDYLEGNLPLAEARDMEFFLAAQPAIAAELEAMRPLVTLTPDDSIVFEAKNTLLRQEKQAAVVFFSPQIRRRLAAAAAALLLLSAAYFIGFKSGLDNKEIQAENETPIQIEQTATPISTVKQESTLADLETVENSPVVVEQTSDVKKNSPVKKQENTPVKYEITATPPIVEMPIAQNEALDKTTPQSLETLAPELSNESTNNAIAQVEVLEELPSLDLNNVQRALPTLDYVEIRNINYRDIALSERRKKTSKLLKGLVDRLPFSEVTAQNFIPSYYSDSAGE